jgi:NACHT domain
MYSVMGQNGDMGVTKYKVRAPYALLAAALGLAAVALLWALKSNQQVGYWLAGAGVVLPLMAPIFNRLVRQVAETAEVEDKLYTEAAKLRAALVGQWKSEINSRLKDPYPLPVPFAVTRQSSAMAGWKAIRTDEKASAVPIKGTFREITKMFTRPGMPRRLVVLGEAGTGKSMIAQWLMLDLLEHPGGTGGRGKEHRVPFFLPLASWDPAQPLEEWAAAKVIDTYPPLGQSITTEHGDRTLARELVAQGRVLMILDGLDEMTPQCQEEALERLSSAAVNQDQCMVVTCRADDYYRLVAERGPLAKSPVIELGRLPMSAVRDYLHEDRAPAGHWDDLLQHLRRDPKGVLAEALSTPLDIWLTRTIYGTANIRRSRRAGARHDINATGQPVSKPGTRLADLFTVGTKEEIRHILLGGLVEAAYRPAISTRYPEREAPEGSRIHNYMVALAKNMFTQERDHQQDIDWWRLHEMCPRVVIGLEIGLIVGPLLGVASGLAIAVKAGQAAGIAWGIAFGAVTGVLAGITCARPQPQPRAVRFEIDFRTVSRRLPRCALFGLAVGATFGLSTAMHGGLIAALITALFVGPTAAWAAIDAFDLAPGITAGITAALAIGLAAGLAAGRPGGLIAGPVAGVVFMIGSWVWIGAYESADSEMAVDPQSLLSDDRRGCLVVGITAGVAFGVIFGLALGLKVGALAVVSLSIAVSLVVSLWGTFMVARLWLAARCGLPLNIMSFLLEAHARGVLRQNGPHYQFRHRLLQERLAGKPMPVQVSANSEAGGNPRPAPPAAVT